MFSVKKRSHTSGYHSAPRNMPCKVLSNISDVLSQKKYRLNGLYIYTPGKVGVSFPPHMFSPAKALL